MRLFAIIFLVSVLALPVFADEMTDLNSSRDQNASLSVPQLPPAKNYAVPNEGLPTDLAQFIEALFKWSLSVLGLVIFVRFFYAGWIWFTAAGNTTRTGQAVSIMTNAALGAVVLVSAYLILYTINPDLVSNVFAVPGLPGAGQ